MLDVGPVDSVEQIRSGRHSGNVRYSARGRNPILALRTYRAARSAFFDLSANVNAAATIATNVKVRYASR